MPAATDFTNALSPLAHDILAIDPPSAYTHLVVRGYGNLTAKKILETTHPAQLLATPVASPDDASALLSALWLWHDWLDASHVISQQIHAPTGSFWHAIMHRREGDFSNSKYWYARCRQHPILANMAPLAGDLLNHLPAHTSLLKLIMGPWNPDTFVDFVEEVHDSPDDPRHAVAVRLQQLEWRLLFDHCMRAASGQ